MAQFPALSSDRAGRIATVGLVSEFELEPVRVRVVEREARGALALGEARTAAIAAIGGVLAGAATVATVRAVAKKSSGGLLPGRKRQPKVVASRSFLVDVHLLGR
jgi:hypothetical protein